MSQPDCASPLTLRLFGPFAAHVNGNPLPRLRSRKGQYLLALLTLRRGATVERSWLAGTLWPDSPASQAMASLRISLADLRRALGSEAGRLRAPTTQTLCLDLTGAEADVLAFDATIARGDRASWERAVALYQGPLLEGCAEEWVFQERQAREEAYLQALEGVAAAAMAAAEPAAAERALRRAVAVDPLRETAQRALMQALAMDGNYAAAWTAYRELRLRLHRELNAEPDAETTALFQRLREEARQKAASGHRYSSLGKAGTVSTARVPDATRVSDSERPLHNLPVPLTRFIGRATELAEVERLLAASRLLTLTGAGGCGKTRLALQIAASQREHFRDGAWLVELAAQADPALVPHAVAAVLGVPEEPGRPVVRTLIDTLHPRRMLLVLDNCEHLLTACAHLSESLLQGCPDLRIMATSREGFGIGGEQTYRVPSLSLPDLEQQPSPESLNRSEAAALFVDRARLSQPTFTVTNSNAAAVAAICHRLDGIPLALELAATRVKTLPVEQIAARLDDRFHLLTGGSRTALPRQRTLRALIDWSYDLLTEPERALLRRLAVFAGGCTLEAAEAIGAGVQADNDCLSSPEHLNARTPERLNAGDVLDLLTSLVDKCLVLMDDAGGEGRFRLLETVRHYARDRLLEAGEAAMAYTLHRDFFLALAERAEPELIGADQAVWFDRLDQEHDNLRSALEWSVSAGENGESPAERGVAVAGAAAEKALRLGAALWWFWGLRGYHQEGRARLAQLLELAGGEAHAGIRAKVLVGAGNLAWHQGDLVDASARYREGLAMFRTLGDRSGAARCLNDQGLMAAAQGDGVTARALQEQALALHRELRNTHGIAWSLHFLGDLALNERDLEAARSRYEESSRLFQSIGEQHGVAMALSQLGAVMFRQGCLAEAESLHSRSLTIKQQLGNKQGIASSLGQLGLVALARGDVTSARALQGQSLAIRSEMKDRAGIATALERIAAVAAVQGQDERAARLLGAAEALRECVGVSPGPWERTDRDRVVATARSRAGEAAWAAAWAEGRATTTEEAIRAALDEPSPGRR